MTLSPETYIEWAAYECYVRDAFQRGCRPWMWKALKEAVRDRFRLEARELVGKWVEQENYDLLTLSSNLNPRFPRAREPVKT